MTLLRVLVLLLAAIAFGAVEAVVEAAAACPGAHLPLLCGAGERPVCSCGPPQGTAPRQCAWACQPEP